MIHEPQQQAILIHRPVQGRLRLREPDETTGEQHRTTIPEQKRTSRRVSDIGTYRATGLCA